MGALIPSGWMTYLGAVTKVLAALLALLTAIQGGDANTVMARLMEVMGLFSVGSAITSAGQRRALERKLPDAPPPAAMGAPSGPALAPNPGAPAAS